uniref:NADH-plastoquinone oxidoreductase subunit 3 n=1 Tax=Pellia epiphylla TaxID=40340 RepID=UPI00257975EC|nr:NADH-plastoquinone oxidoreductase subunit 3 [Pellia epiphylla]WIA67389.1 NADH-plastoquinone oxidoreductase subunit 3 [Pellia epiphylla var. borealis]WIA67474.1 NADH-plastoquinone oxidoreductase subunit 3 [Pellia epiphylla var. borealis]WIA67912.1 NADH-plastoquinone oxidoreductase subunit 3 [Pellia epiphylla]WIA67997.1 NADH-plastoquinone oxidoreductase subunit 3 [Pellia epiphylla]WIA68083.1 NADH-plastoquinone oxidoreductase subunit 3 [Pellia epiphylla]
MLQSDKYEYFWIFLLIVVFLPAIIFWISELVVPTSKGSEKSTSYESGIEPLGEACIQFQIRYYMFALVFVIFDVETVFLYPWAMSFYDFGILPFIEALIFILILIVGLVYAWRKGALEWS